MRWIMRRDFEIAYIKANEILEKINYTNDYMIRTASVIDAVEKSLDLDVRFTDYDFSKINLKGKKVDISNLGAATCVSEIQGKKYATIIINEKETPQMKRFSLVHELGHLMTQSCESFKDYQVSTHIDMDITTIPDEILNKTENEFLIREQIANIFALLVLVPYELLVEAIKKLDSLEKVADFFGVERNAIISRLWLEDAKKLLNAE